MRTLFLLISLASTFFVSAQSKTETIDWLNSKFSVNPIIYGEFIKFSRKMKIYPDGKFEITVSSFEIPLDGTILGTTIIKGHFKDFTPNSVTVRKEDNLIFISMNCYNSKRCITITQTGKPVGTLELNGVVFGAFLNAETNIDVRLRKAFINLIKLSGGKKEAF